MTHSIRVLPLLAVLFLPIPFSAQADDGDGAVLARLLETFLAGASENDVAVHERFWAEDLVYTSSGGERFGKAQIIASLAQAEAASDEAGSIPPDYSARETDIRVFGDTAIVTFRLMAERDGEIVGEYFNTGVFRRGSTGWQAVAWQATRTASTAASGSPSGNER